MALKPWQWWLIGGGLFLMSKNNNNLNATVNTPIGAIGGGQALSVETVYALAREAGFPPDTARKMVAIAMRESGLVPTARCKDCFPGIKEDSIGLWQINMYGTLGAARLQQFGLSSPDQMLDPRVNARAAFLTWGGNDRNLEIAWRIDSEGAYGYRTKYLANLNRLPGFETMEMAYSGQSNPWEVA